MACYAIISDIHGNAEALRAVLNECKNLGVEKICCLGDIVGYGASLGECLDLVRENCAFIIHGNHDAQVVPPRNPDMRPEAVEALKYAEKILPPAEIKWLQNLPDILVVDNLFIICHGALTSNNDYILSAEAALTNIALLERDYPTQPLVFFGHTHLPMALTKHGAKTDFVDGGKIAIDPQKKYLLNPGSVGQPRDRTAKSSFIVYDVAQQQVVWHRLAYPVATEQEKMRRAGMPEKSWQRIALGR